MQKILLPRIANAPLLPCRHKKRHDRSRVFSIGQSSAAAPYVLILHRFGSRAVVGREELAHRELDLPEQLAGVLLAAVAAAVAVLLRHAVVVGRHEQLGVPLQADDGKLAQGNKQAMHIAAGDQLLREAGAHRGRNLAAVVVVMALAYLHQLHPQDDGIHRLHHGGGSSGSGQALDVTAAVLSGGGEHLGAAFAAKEDHPLVKHRQTGDLHGAGGAHKGVGGNAVEVPHIHGVEPPVEGDRLHIDVRVQQLGATRLHRYRPVNDLLAAPGGVDPQVLDAVFIGRYSGFNALINKTN